MKSKAILAGAAIAGLMSGSFAVQAHAANVTNKAGVSLKQMNDEAKDVHSCKGQNSCKGKGGCKSGDTGCKGQNSGKGKGGCAPDGSQPAPSPSNDADVFAQVCASCGRVGVLASASPSL
jgi:hypothetical protein